MIKVKLKDLCDLILLIIFFNIPKSDLEMIFPNPRPKMNLIDKLKIFVPLVIGLYFLLQKTIYFPKLSIE